jgi:hypothetical protein
MSRNGWKTVETWLIRLIIIHFMLLLAGQYLMANAKIKPYLNKAVRVEGVFDRSVKAPAVSVERLPQIWYHK